VFSDPSDGDQEYRIERSDEEAGSDTATDGNHHQTSLSSNDEAQMIQTMSFQGYHGSGSQDHGTSKTDCENTD
jgi:hypothetical protein